MTEEYKINNILRKKYFIREKKNHKKFIIKILFIYY